MRLPIGTLILLLTLLVASLAAPTLQNSRSKIGNNDEHQKPFVEEVVVESYLHVRSPIAGRQARTNASTNLKDGSNVLETRKIN